MSIISKNQKTPDCSTGNHVIRISDLTKNFQMGDTVVHALRGISFDLAHGEYMSIMGTSGSGKSTLLNIIGCIDQPTDGEYYLSGSRISLDNNIKAARLRNQHFGFILQEFALVDHLTVLQNMELPLFYREQKLKTSARHAICRQLAERLGIADKFHTLTRDLSGGQKQRTAIGRALVNSPQVILADEPTGSLDKATTTEIMGIFTELNAMGKTILIVTHNPLVAEFCSRKIQLEDGLII